MPKQTSIEWLVNQVEDFIGLIPVDIIEKAQQMHKDEITIAYGSDRFPCSDADCEDYYQETYGGNHIVDTNKMVKAEEKPMTFVPKEISDEEIGKGCDENIPLDEADMWSERLYFRTGAKWYREQLNKKEL